MTYASQADITARFGVEELQQLTDRELPLLGEIDAVVLARALNDSDGVIDSHLGARYQVPLAATYPAEVVRIACDIARYFLHALAAPEPVRVHYDDALKWLRRVADGKLPLIDASGAIVSAKASAFGPSAVAPYSSGAMFGEAFAAAWQP